MGVEECLDCGGVVADTAVTCPHCGSKANFGKRNQPSAAEMMRARVAEEKAELAKKKTNIGCGALIVIVIIIIGIIVGTYESEEKQYTPAEKLELIEKYGGFDD